MPLDRLVLIIVIVLAAAGVTVWLGTMVAAAVQIPQVGWLIFVPVALVAYIAWRIVADRLGSKEDDRYDRIEK